MTAKISSRLYTIKPSATLAVTQKMGELRAMGVDVIGFCAGEPDFDTPPHIVEAAKRALDAGDTRYTPAAGTVELKKAVAAQSHAVRGVSCSAEQVIVCAGAKHVLFNFFMAVLDVGDEVVIPEPCWVSYPDQVSLAGGVPVFAKTKRDNGWVLTPAELERVVTSKTKALLLNSPSNPTGGLYDRTAMNAIVERALSLGLYVVSDEIYRDLIYDGSPFVSALDGVHHKRDQVFVVDGVSKSYAMTGWRIGWGIGDPDIIAAMTTFQGQSITNPTSISQAAALAAITTPNDFLPVWKTEYQKRRDFLVRELNAIEGVFCPLPKGAFYAFPDVSALIQKLGASKTDVDFATWLLDEANIATVPGTPFGAPGYIRLAYATSMELIVNGMERMAAACKRL